MKSPHRFRRGMSLCGVSIAAAAVFAGALRAEVGATKELNSTLNSPYILQSIIEDPEPIDSIWERYNLDNGSRSVLNEAGDENGDGPPSILRNPVSERSMVAWARNSASGYDVVISQFVNGSWSEPQVLAGSLEDELDPHLVLDPATGDVHVFYWIDEATPRVMHRQAPADLSSWSDPLQVSEAGEPACRPAGVFHENALYVVYELHSFGAGQTPREIVLSRREQGEFILDVIAITNYSEEVWPEVHSHAGRTWIDWIDASDEMAWTRKDLQGQWEPTRYETFTSREERDFLVRGAVRMKAIE